MSDYTQEKRAYMIEACAEAVVKVLKSQPKKQGKYLPINKYRLFILAAERVANDWQSDKHFHSIDGKREIPCPDADYIRRNWGVVKNAGNELLRNRYITPVMGRQGGMIIGGDKELAIALNHQEKVVKGTVRQHNIQAELANKRGSAYQFLQVKQLALPQVVN